MVLPAAANSSTVSPQSNLARQSVVVRFRSIGFGALVLLGIISRLVFIVIPGNALRTPWSGGGDTEDYVLLAHNLLSHMGYSYGGQPSAFRPPLYPLLLAAFMKILGGDYALAMRVLQFFEGLAVVLICAAIAKRIFGDRQAKLTLLIALFLPTLVEMSAEILTEAPATVLTVLFLYSLVRYSDKGDWVSLAGMSVTAAIGALIRSNLAFLVCVSLGCVLLRKRGRLKWRDLGIATILPCVLISPWVARNLFVFHGSALFSTQGGFAAVAGVLSPQGRAQTDEMIKIHDAIGLPMAAGLETNDPIRAQLPSEPEIDRRCWRVAIHVWKQTGWRLVPITLKKIGYFWLSTDQLLWTGNFSLAQRAARAIGVLAYWLVLFFGLLGWFRLRAENPALAKVFLMFAVIVTLLHIPFNMNTRYRMTFMDPLLAVLAGEGVLILIRRFAGGLAAKL